MEIQRSPLPVAYASAARRVAAGSEACLSLDPTDKVVSAEIESIPFDKFLKYKTYEVGLQNAGEVKLFRGGFVHGPGHHISAIAALAFDESMHPHPIFKSGDTRLSRSERQEPYVLQGAVAGRLDKTGATASKIVLAELAEEVGGEVVEGTFLPLGGGVVPTMPFESTESDSYYMAAVSITGKPYGDGGQMEVVDLIGPLISSAQDAIVAMDNGSIAEGGRARAMFGRGFDAIGFIPQLDLYVHDHLALKERFDTLGLGPAIDLRGMVEGGKLPEAAAKGSSLEARINDVVVREREETWVGPESKMVSAQTSHALREGGQVTALEARFANQYLHLDYDRAKVAVFYLDPGQGPMIEMTPQMRPALAFAPESPKVLRQDVSDLKLSRDGDALEQLQSQLQGKVVALGSKTPASSGQSDLYYHFVGCEIEPPAGPEAGSFLPLAKAIELCRSGHGDAQTEALCERLADSLGWIPNLGMSLDQARRLISTTGL